MILSMFPVCLFSVLKPTQNLHRSSYESSNHGGAGRGGAGGRGRHEQTLLILLAYFSLVTCTCVNGRVFRHQH